MLYREIIAVCSQIHTKHIHALCGQKARVIERDGGTYSNYWAVKGYMTEVTGILDMGPFQQHDLQTYIKFHYNTALQNKYALQHY